MATGTTFTLRNAYVTHGITVYEIQLSNGDRCLGVHASSRQPDAPLAIGACTRGLSRAWRTR